MYVKSIASGSSGNAYIISDGETNVIIECGINIKTIRRGINFSLSTVSGLLISHRHNDHCKSVKDFLKVGIDIYAPQDVFDSKNVSGHCCHAIENLKSFNVGTFLVVPFELEHDVINYGFMLHSQKTGKRLLYFTDTFWLRYKFSDITCIMAECNFGEPEIAESATEGIIPQVLKARIRATHMSLERLIKIFKDYDMENVEQIYLIHLSKHNSNPERFKAAVAYATGKDVHIC